MNRLRRIALIALLTVVLFALAGCGIIAQKAVEGATGVKVDNNDKKVTVTGKNGETATMSGQEGKLPDGLPADVPAYSGTIKSSSTMDTAKGTNYTFAVETADEAATIVGWYKDKLAEKGWKISTTFTSGDGAMLGAEKGGKNNLAVTISKDSSSNKTMVVVVDSITK